MVFCGGCGKEKVKFATCKGCRQAYYCNKACQKKDWQQGHREACREACREAQKQNALKVDEMHQKILTKVKSKADVAMILNETGLDINSRDSSGLTCLHKAVTLGSPDLFTLLADQERIDLNSRDDSTGNTALHLAAEYQPDAVTTLVQQEGIQLNLQNKDGWTALHIAAQSSSAAVTTLVQQEGIQLNLQSKDGWTALHIAADYQPDAVTTLVQQQGIQLNLQSKDGWTALLPAVSQAHKAPYVQAVQALLKTPNVDINARSPNDDRALSLITKLNPHLLFDLLPLHGSLGPQKSEEFTTLIPVLKALGDAQHSIEGWSAEQVRQAQEAGFQAIYGHFRQHPLLQLQFSQLPPQAQDRLRKVDHDLNALRVLYSQLLRTSSFKKIPERGLQADILLLALDQGSAMRASASTLSGVSEYLLSLAELNHL